MPKKSRVSGGLESIPPGAHLLTVEKKAQYEMVPVHVYHPTPHDAITVLKSKMSPHEWLVCGWYIDTYREGGEVKGLLYRQVVTDGDKEIILAELKKQDKEAVPSFSVQPGPE